MTSGPRGSEVVGSANDWETTYQSLGPLDVLRAKEKLAVQVAQIYRVQVDDVNFTEAGEEEVFQQFAADATGADEENSRLQH